MDRDVDGNGKTITRTARRESLPALLDFVERACRGCGADDAATFALRLAVEEACMNLILHGYADRGAGPITLGFRCDASELIVTVRDQARAFSPDEAPAVDVAAHWEQRRIGGLGWHLIRRMTDALHYESDAERGNCLTLVKKR